MNGEAFGIHGDGNLFFRTSTYVALPSRIVFSLLLEIPVLMEFLSRTKISRSTRTSQHAGFNPLIDIHPLPFLTSAEQR